MVTSNVEDFNMIIIWNTSDAIILSSPDIECVRTGLVLNKLNCKASMTEMKKGRLLNTCSQYFD